MEALTPSEWRIVKMAARGCSNREIAEALFVTKETVESHLRNSHTKLGIDLQEDLAAALEGAAPRSHAR